MSCFRCSLLISINVLKHFDASFNQSKSLNQIQTRHGPLLKSRRRDFSFFKGSLVPNFNNTFDLNLVLMAVQQSEEGFSTVGTNLHAWLNILGQGESVVRRDGLIRGIIIYCTLPVVSSSRDTWTLDRLLKNFIHTETLRHCGNSCGEVSVYKTNTFCSTIGFPTIFVILSFSVVDKCQYYFYCNVYLTLFACCLFCLAIFTPHFYEFSRVSTRIYFCRDLPYWKKNRWFIGLFQKQ